SPLHGGRRLHRKAFANQRPTALPLWNDQLHGAGPGRAAETGVDRCDPKVRNAVSPFEDLRFVCTLPGTGGIVTPDVPKPGLGRQEQHVMSPWGNPFGGPG